MHLPVTATDRGDADEVAALDVGEAPLGHGDDRRVRRKSNGQLLTAPRLDLERLAIERRDGAANAQRRSCRSLRKRRNREQGTDGGYEISERMHRPSPLSDGAFVLRRRPLAWVTSSPSIHGMRRTGRVSNEAAADNVTVML